MEHPQLDATGPPVTRAASPPEPAEPFPEYDLVDPAPEE